MRHELSLDGFGWRLRPIADADAPFVVALRGDPALNRYLHRGSPRHEDQLAWFADYYERPGDFYFVVESRTGAEREGLVAIYDAAPDGSAAEWGRWILRAGSLAAVESAWLVYRVAFEQLSLGTLYCRTVAENAQVVSFHDACGIASRTLLPGHFELGGRRMDAVEHRVDRGTWIALEPRLRRLAQRAAAKMNHGRSTSRP